MGVTFKYTPLCHFYKGLRHGFDTGIKAESCAKSKQGVVLK